MANAASNIGQLELADLDRPEDMALEVPTEEAPGADQVDAAALSVAMNTRLQSPLSLVQTNLPEYRSALERLIGRLTISDKGCWIWTGCKNPAGYGLIRDRGKWLLVHRMTYSLFRGEIPAGLHLDHLCRVRSCCNPRHLEAVSCKENLLRGIGVNAINAAKTHCPAGHPLSGDNLRVGPNGRRKCRSCEREQQRKRRLTHGR